MGIVEIRGKQGYKMGFKREEGPRPGTEADVAVIHPFKYAELNCAHFRKKTEIRFLKILF